MGILFLLIASAAWLGYKASIINDNLRNAVALAPQVEAAVAANRLEAASESVQEIEQSTRAARAAVDDPLWKLAGALPLAGENFRAVSEIAVSADDLVQLGAKPLLDIVGTLEWQTLVPRDGGVNLEPLEAAGPKLQSVAHAVRESSDRLNGISAGGLVPQISAPVTDARAKLTRISKEMDSAAEIAEVAPTMLGGSGPRDYLLLIQNNAESRASGGIPGALAVLTLNEGKLTLGAQASTADIPSLSPALQVDPEQELIYSKRLGRYIQDVNLTPDFPTAASTAQAMWERQTGKRVAGVVSIDPIALGYVLAATGPVTVGSPELLALTGGTLPSELTADNVVPTLLSDVYTKIQRPASQDAYFAGVAQQIFAALSDGRSDAKMLIEGLSRGAREGRMLLWSSFDHEQSVISKHILGGSVSGPAVSPAQFGVYFNDGTGAKMDYYVRRTVQLIKECPKEGYEQTTVRVTSLNTAPADAATSLPAYVTGDGNFGVPPGAVQTNIVAYGPVQAHVETAKLDGQKTEFAPYFHGNRPVGVLAIQLAPGESQTVDFTFGKIVQHTEPNVVVTPTVQDVKDVTLPTETAACG
ncbi:UNVERIFIED_CONTAM: DUF4012 domain-containing protein [Actinomycetes bacterium ARC8]|nr:DUF4012 domain-containing protein [Actinomycetes bacterium ARC8]